MSYIHDISQTQSIETHHWRVYCRSCSEPIIVTNVICEKNSIPYVVKCRQQHFTCNEGTCIVDMYRCDSIADCFDTSDEENCLPYVSNVTNQFINIHPLLLGTRTLETTEVITIPLHALCNGIHSNETIMKWIFVFNTC